MSRDAYKALMQHSLRLKQVLTSFTDPANLQESHLQTLKDLTAPISEAAAHFARERKIAMKKNADGKLREMGLRVDQEGTAIYNRVEEMTASETRSQSPHEVDILLAQIRLAAYRIIQATDDGHQDDKNLIGRLDLVTKTAVHLIQTEQEGIADEILLSAADIEDALIVSIEEGNGELSEHAVLCVVDYYMGRVDAAIKQQVPQVGTLFVDKAIDLITNHSVPVAKIRDIATRCWEIGDEVRTQSKRDDPETMPEAIEWLHRSLAVVEWLQKQIKPVSWVKDLHIAVNRSLVRCHLLLGESDRDALEKAKAFFFDLTKLVNSRDPKVTCEAAIFNLRILRMSDAPAAEIKTCIDSLLSQIVWSHEVVEELLAAFTYRDASDDVSGEALVSLLEAAEGSEAGLAFSPDVQLALFTFLRSYAKAKSSKAMTLASFAVDLLAQHNDMRHGEEGMPACETIIWGLRDYFNGQSQDETAVQWYELALHPVFQRGDLPANQHIIRRKAALCYIRSQNLAKAQEVLRSCPQDQAATQYLNFLVALYQNKESAACQAIDNICRCPDLQPLQLQLMVSMADEVQNKPILMKALSTLLDAIKDSKIAKEIKVEGFNLLRTLIRLSLSELGEGSETDTPPKIEDFIRYLDSAHDLFLTSDEPESKANDMVWLYKSVLNMAIQGGKRWAPELAAGVFDKAVQLMEDYATLSRSNGDPDLQNQKASGYFAVLSGKIFEFRGMEQGDDKALLLGHLQNYLPKCRAAVEAALASGPPHSGTLPQMEKMIDVYFVELCCEDQDWDGLDTFIKEVAAWPKSMSRAEPLEMIMDIAGQYPGIPSDLTWQLNNDLHKSATINTPKDLARYARSTRALLTSQAQDKNAEQRMIDIMDHAISVLQRPVGQQGSYPEDEGIWLLATAFNRGLDCFDEDDFEGAHLWNGVAKDLFPLVKGGDGFETRLVEQKRWISQHYGSVKK